MLLSPLLKDRVNDHYVQVGGTVQQHNFDPDDINLLQHQLHFIPRRGKLKMGCSSGAVIAFIKSFKSKSMN